MRAIKNVKGMALLDNTLGLIIASGITAISLTQLPDVLDSADKSVTKYAMEATRSHNSTWSQYAQAHGIKDFSAPEMELSGFNRVNENQLSSPLQHYCFSPQQPGSEPVPCKSLPTLTLAAE